MSKFERKEIFVHAELLEQLKRALPTAAEAVATFRQVLEQHFPWIHWNNQTLWVLAHEPNARQVLRKQLLEMEAERMELPCHWDLPDEAPRVKLEMLPEKAEHTQPISEEIRLNRKLVLLRVRDILPRLDAVAGKNLGEYLRAGALTIDENGKTITRPEALADFCTLFAETPQQARFAEALERMQEKSKDMTAAYFATLAFLPSPVAKKEFTANAGFYCPTIGGLTRGKWNYLPLMGSDTIPRALITFFSLAWKREAEPKFYNEAGVWQYTAEEAAAVVGCEPKEIGLLSIRNVYPKAFRTHHDPANGGPTAHLSVYPQILSAQGKE